MSMADWRNHIAILDARMDDQEAPDSTTDEESDR